jgi:hypothetical protein
MDDSINITKRAYCENKTEQCLFSEALIKFVFYTQLIEIRVMVTSSVPL